MTTNEERFPRSDWDALTPDEQYALARGLAWDQDQLHELLALVPCPEHGPCIPHLREWIQARLTPDYPKPRTVRIREFVVTVTSDTYIISAPYNADPVPLTVAEIEAALAALDADA